MFLAIINLTPFNNTGLIPETSVSDSLYQSQFDAQRAAETWDEAWKVYFDLDGTQSLATHLLWKVVLLAAFIVLAFALFFSFYFLFKQTKTEPSEQQESLAEWVAKGIFVLILIANNGKLISSLCWGLRAFFLWFNDLILNGLTISNNYTSLAEAYADFKGWKVANTLIATAMTQCEVLLGQEQLNCIQRQASSLQARLTLEGASVKTSPNILDSLQSFIDNPPLAINNYMTSVFEHHVGNLLLSFMQGFQFVMELSFLVTAFIAPVAIVGILFPFKPNPFIAWLTGFCSIGIAKVSFNLAAAMTAVMAIKDVRVFVADQILLDDLPLFLVFGFFCPVIATGISYLGGMAIWQGLTNAAGQIASKSVDLLLRFI